MPALNPDRSNLSRSSRSRSRSRSGNAQSIEPEAHQLVELINSEAGDLGSPRLGKAVEKLETFRNQVPKDSPHYAGFSATLGRFWLCAGECSHAAELLTTALRGRLPVCQDVEARRNLIGANWRLGSMQSAEEVCRRACKLYPGKSCFWEARGDVLARQARELRAGCGDTEKVGALFEASVAALYVACDLDPRSRTAHQSLIKQLASSRRLEEERAAAQMSVDRRLGLWDHPLQRPEHFLPGLLSKPWHDAKDFSWCASLEQNFEQIRGELSAVAADPSLWPLVAPGELSLTGGSGAWREVVLLGPGSRRGRKACPLTSALLERIPGAKALAKHRAGCGNAIFSKLDPGVHLHPHCGPTNTRLTCHLGIEVPEGCAIRVGSETRMWREGECLVFDDSWEHEVWNRGGRPRVVLLVNFWHPDLPSGWHPDQLLCPSKYG